MEGNIESIKRLNNFNLVEDIRNLNQPKNEEKKQQISQWIGKLDEIFDEEDIPPPTTTQNRRRMSESELEMREEMHCTSSIRI